MLKGTMEFFNGSLNMHFMKENVIFSELLKNEKNEKLDP
jgi:hypothetical protein